MGPDKKRRRLDNGGLDTKYLSAFAARKYLEADHKAEATQDDGLTPTSLRRDPSARRSSSRTTVTQSLHGPLGTPVNTIDLETHVPEAPSDAGSARARGEDSALASASDVVLTTIKRNKESFREERTGVITVKLRPGERLVVLGEYGLAVRSGQVTILGATLQPSSTIHHVFAFSTHSLPVIRPLASEDSGAEIRLHNVDSGLRSLGKLSSLYRRIGNERLSKPTSETQTFSGSSCASFTILFAIGGFPRKSYLNILKVAPEWHEALANLAGQIQPLPKLHSPSEQSSVGPITMICGPKSSGKSTFAKLLTNQLLTRDAKGSKGVLFLDIDPGQPEYSPPGQLSLIYLREPNFGPAYSHPCPSEPGRQVIRAHSIASNSPSYDTPLFMAYIADLLTHVRKSGLSHYRLPLIINTPGWVLGTGLQILIDLINLISPSDIVYMSTEGPEEVVKSLQEAGETSRLVQLPSQTSVYTGRTAADLRHMQAMSYFHFAVTGKGVASWLSNALSSLPPWQVTYSGSGAGILGVICVDEDARADMLNDRIDGTMVGILVIEKKPDTVATQILTHSTSRPSISISPMTLLPYFDSALSKALRPQDHYTLGLALIRGIDVERHKLQLLTPVAPKALMDVMEAGNEIVLLSGNLDIPAWAYTEELHRRDAKGFHFDMMANQDGERATATKSRGFDDQFEAAPWVQRVYGDRGRGTGSKVWRVRRDLGRADADG